VVALELYRLVGDDTCARLREAIGVEHGAPGDELMQHHADGPDVRTMIGVRIVTQTLGRHVRRRAVYRPRAPGCRRTRRQHRARRCSVFCRGPGAGPAVFGDAEVEDFERLELTVAREK